MAAGHRSFVLSFITFGVWARMVRFDTSGIIYSAPFEWGSTDYLAEFFVRMARARPQERGFDTSFWPISCLDDRISSAKRIFDKAVQSGVLPPSVGWDTTFEIPKVDEATYWLCEVYDERTTTIHEVLINKPHVCAQRLHGRFTRGYIGVDLAEGCVVYLKRSWRVFGTGVPREYDVYWDLEKGHVPHLPDCYFGGDVPVNSADLARQLKSGAPFKPSEEDLKPLQTVSSTFADEEKLVCALSMDSALDQDAIEYQQHTLHVILMKKIGSPLYEFQSTYDLTSTIRDAVESASDSILTYT